MHESFSIDPDGVDDQDMARSDEELLRALNAQFIDACREGSWEQLQQVLDPAFRYVDGGSGELWDTDDYIADLRANPTPSLSIDQVVVHVAGDTAGVTARTSNGHGRHNRYLDVYQRSPDGWACVQACVWAADPDPQDA